MTKEDIMQAIENMTVLELAELQRHWRRSSVCCSTGGHGHAGCGRRSC